MSTVKVGMFLNILQCPGQLSTTKNDLAPIVKKAPLDRSRSRAHVSHFVSALTSLRCVS